MALDFLKLSDEKLANDWAKPSPESYMPKRRAQVARYANSAAKAAKEGKQKFRNGGFEISNGVAAARIRLGKDDIKVGDKEVHFIPAERLVDFYTGVAKAAEAGELDKSFDYEPDQAEASTVRSSSGTRQMSEEHRKAISDAAKKRWAEKKKAEQAG